jgi:hypothetical protein
MVRGNRLKPAKFFVLKQCAMTQGIFLMMVRFILTVLIMMPGLAVADASNGEFMGYQLGGHYQSSENTRQQKNTNGNLIITAENPVKPGDIAEVSLLTTSESNTIGYIDASQWFKTEEEARQFARTYVELLRAKYPEWAFGRERMDSDMRIVEVNLDEPPYNLRLQLTEDEREQKSMWRFSMALGWLPDAQPARAWRTRSRDEHLATREGSREQLLKDADLSGL